MTRATIMTWRDRHPGLATLILLGLASAAPAQIAPLLNVSRDLSGPPATKTERFPFSIPTADAKITVVLRVDLTAGSATIRVLDPNDTPLRDPNDAPFIKESRDGKLSDSSVVLGPRPAGRCTLEVSTQAALGTWQALLVEIPPPAKLRPLLLAGPLMILIALAFAVGWKMRFRDRWRWLWVGAAIWAVGVALKFACAIPLNKPVLRALESALPHSAYVAAGAVYVGLLTGVFEIGVTLAAALIWRKLATTPNRAVSIGVGAGGFEALLLGIAALGGMLFAVSGMPAAEPALASAAATVAVTPLAWLASPLERIIAILCHTSSRTLVLLAVARRRAAYFWYGFLLMTVLDGVAGVAYLTGAVTFRSVWWIELAILPFGIISVPILRWCLRQWPAEPVAEPPAVPPALPST
jgi:uncharacterized membrane protein YhfC